MAIDQSIPTHLSREAIVERLYAQVNSSGVIDVVAHSIARSHAWCKKFESPIEHLFAATWAMDDSLRAMCGDPYSYVLVPQREVVFGKDTYRPDFQVFGRHLEMPRTTNTLWRVAIELDGHEFHERTREQVAYRNKRDRAFQSNDWKLFHFSGSEVWRDPAECVREVKTYCNAELDKTYEDYANNSAFGGVA